MDLSKFLPSLVRSSPSDGDRDVPLRPDIELEFSVDLHPDVLTTAEISKHLMLLEAVTERSIAMQLVQPATQQRSSKIVLRPESVFSPDTDYILVILPTLPAYTGRTAGVRTIISFRTAPPALQIPTPAPLQPGYNERVHSLPVTLSWDGWSSPPAGYTLLYEVQLARDERFVDMVWYSVLSDTGVEVPEQYTADGNYSWRVRILLRQAGTDELVPGRWSPVSQFVLRTSVTPVSYTGEGGVGITCNLDEEGVVMALQRSWPTIALYRVPTPYTVELQWRNADGYPDWEWHTMDVALTEYDSSPDDGVVDRLLVAPAEDIGTSRAYRLAVRLSDGRILWERSFFANLRPLYVHPDVVKYRIADLISAINIDDDDICFYIYRKSLEANRHFYRWVLVGWAGPVESTVRGLDISQYFAVQRWVELQACVDILGRHLLQISSRIGTRQRLGDYYDDYEPNALREARELRKQLQKESILWLSEFSRLRAVAVTASKGSLNPAYQPYGPHPHPNRNWNREWSERWRH